METKKSRKVQESRETALMLLVGFLVAAWLKCDIQLYFGYVAALVGKTSIFTWGLGKEYESNTKVEVAKASAPPTPGQP